MAPALVIFLQSAGAVLPAPSLELPPLLSRTACPRSEGSEILVCGKRDRAERYRLRALPAGDFEARPVLAKAGLAGGATAGVTATAKELGPGIVSNRIMFEFKLPF